ncbi:MAG: glycosyl hydrolase 53 family protein [Bacteroidota bacterium]
MTRPLLLVLLLVTTNAGAQPAPMACGDVSFLDEMETAGAIYREGGQPGDALAILRRAGLDTVRLRLWHTPEPDRDDLPDVLTAATRADALGLRIVLAIHYSDTWADPAQQTPPAAWQGLDASALRDSVGAYTGRVVGAMVQQGTPPEIVQVGNETTGGMLWPHGRVGGAFDTPEQWARLGELFASATDAVREVAPEAAVMLHLDRGGDAAGATWFVDRLFAEGVRPDVIGLSFYPWWHGDLGDLEATLGALASRYGLPLFLTETGYPWTLAWYDDTNNLVGLPGQVLPGYPATPEGQAAFVARVAQIAREVPGGLGACYWAPDWVAAPGEGSAWENVALFDASGEVLPAASALAGSAVSAESLPASVPSRAYPNPASRVVWIETEAVCTEVRLTDAIGREVATARCRGGTARMPVDRLAPGVYRYTADGAAGRTSGTVSVVR